MHANPATCAQCGKTTPAGQSCPHCLMALGMNAEAAAGHAPTMAPQGNSEVDIPQVEKVNAAFPDLEICHLVGHGGMGVVYQARQVNLNRIVALKILSPRLSREPAFAERFLREAQTMAKLSHPNIVTVFDFGKADDFYYLTMEFVDGVNLRDTIATNKLSASEALAIVPQVCEALQYAHDNGVVHRDIKPENILIDKSGEIKIADFGLAKLLDPTPNQVSLTATRQVLGTRNYMAPEQLETPDVVDHRADLYSLGVVFYELLTGELPLGRFSLPSEKSLNVSSRLDDVVMRTLEKDPGRRYQQASQIKTACETLEKPAAHSERSATPNQPESKSPPVCQPLPVTLEDIYASLASGVGLLRTYESHLELEFEIRDAVVSHRWASSCIDIPLERVSSINLVQKKWRRPYIEIQADQFDVVKDIPCSEQGKFRVYLKKKDLNIAEQLVWQVQNRIGAVPQEVYPPTAPAKPASFNSAIARRDTNGLLGAVLLLVFLGFCVIGGLAIIFGSVYLTRTAAPSKPPAPIEQAMERPASATAVDVDGNAAVHSNASSSDRTGGKAESTVPPKKPDEVDQLQNDGSDGNTKDEQD